MAENTIQKKRNSYSFSLKKTDNPLIKEFIDNQTNFSETLRYLIYKYAMENGTSDISFKLNDLIFNHITSLQTNKNIANEVNVSIEETKKEKPGNDTVPICYK